MMTEHDEKVAKRLIRLVRLPTGPARKDMLILYAERYGAEKPTRLVNTLIRQNRLAIVRGSRKDARYGVPIQKLAPQ